MAAGLLRVVGKDLAELPFAATAIANQRKVSLRPLLKSKSTKMVPSTLVWILEHLVIQVVWRGTSSKPILYILDVCLHLLLSCDGRGP